MARRQNLFERDSQLQRFLIANARPTGRQLGVGSYGSVEELEVSGVVCAGKKIHETLIEPGNLGAENIATKYAEECQLMSDLRHPHLVQFLGVCFLPNSTLPVLVMERLLTSLDELLEHNPDIPLSLKRSILADVARGLVYLHSRSPPVIHRDLSARNVLLNSAMVAKISDLGNARIVNIQPGQLARTLSRIPGTRVYMPPEAFDVRARYGPSLDNFSFGHLALFTIIQVFPGDLLPHTYRDPENTARRLARTEVERRDEYIKVLHQQLGEHHTLVRLIKQCLDDEPSARPTAQQLLRQLEGMRDQIEDPYEHLTKLEAIRMLKQKDAELQRIQFQLNQSLQVCASRKREVVSMEADLDAREIHSQDVGANAEQLQRVKEFAEHKNQSLEMKEKKPPTLQKKLSQEKPKSQFSPTSKLKWRTSAELPIAMYRPSLVRISNNIYCGGGNSGSIATARHVFQYATLTEQWSVLPLCPTWNFALAQFNGSLVAAGGVEHGDPESTFTKSIYTFDEFHWKKLLPPMPTSRSCASAFTYGIYLIVCGGITSWIDIDQYTCTSAVEIFSSDDKQWMTAEPLPFSIRNLSFVVTKDMCYCIGGACKEAARNVAACASLALLVESAKVAATSKHFFDISQPNAPQSSSIWKSLPNCPLFATAATELADCVIAIGGITSSSTNIYFLSPSNNTWQKASEANFPIQLFYAAATTLDSGDIFVVGGRKVDNYSILDTVFIGSIVG